MSKAKEYRLQYLLIKNSYEEDALPPSLLELVEEMLEEMSSLEESASKEYQAKRLKQEASARTGIYDV